MTDTLTARHLFNSLQSRLGLDWVAGRGGELAALIDPATHETSATLVGHLNFIHHSRVQVLGIAELRYLAGLDPDAHDAAMRQLFSERTGLVIVAGDQPVPEGFVEAADACDIPLFTSTLGSNRLINNMQYFLSHAMAETTTMHGVFMEVLGIGVLLTGGAGIGKSELALELITRGHRLVADDAPEFARITPDIVNGTCPEMLREFLEVRGLGVLNIRAMFGDSAIKHNKYLRLIIRLEQMSDEQLQEIDRLQGSRRTARILGVEIPEISLPVAPGRNLAVLTEAAVRTHIISLKGYEPYRDFVQRQKDHMKPGTP